MTLVFVALWVAITVAAVWLDHRVEWRRQEPMRQDVDVLRVAVFNHLRHGGDPDEGHIREVLGFGGRE